MAKPVTVTISHELGREGARGRIDGGIDRMLSSIGGGMVKFDRSWSGDTMSFDARAMGQHVTGTVEVREEDATITVRLPLLLAGMAEKLTGRIKTDGQLLLGKK